MELVIERALSFAEVGGDDSSPFNQWVIDQMVRALTECALYRQELRLPDGTVLMREVHEPNERYAAWVSERGSWSEGTSPIDDEDGWFEE